MKGFIRVTERNGDATFLINADHIVAIRDMQNDPALRYNNDWRWTVIETTKSIFEVKETEEEICELLNSLNMVIRNEL